MTPASGYPGATEQVQLTVPELSGAEAADLANALTALNGVGHVEIDTTSHTLLVRYDPDYSNPSIIKRNLEGAGYRVEEEL